MYENNFKYSPLKYSILYYHSISFQLVKQENQIVIQERQFIADHLIAHIYIRINHTYAFI